MLFSILGTPAWENHGAGVNHVPRESRDLESFALAAAARYSGTWAGAGQTLPAVHLWVAWPVSAWFSAPGVHSDRDACSWFADAARALRKLGSTCLQLPALPREEQTRLSLGELDFTDPPHVAGLGYRSGGSNPARGFFLFAPAASDRIETDAAATATCTLPASNRRICSASLSSIRAEFRSEAKPEPPY